jgi:hypothetical protein
MNRRIISMLLAAFCLGLLLAGDRSTATQETSLAHLAPQGALLYLEAKDFSSLLAQWNGSQQKADWLRSDNYAMFSKSRLFLRLKEAGDQFATAAGIPPDMKFVSQAAGSQSALAIYDIGKLEFLYVTRLGAGHAEPAVLAESRSKFESRSTAGQPFYVRKDPQSGREVAFATSGDYLLLATREDLLAHSLELLTGAKGPAVGSEPWWTDSVAAAGPAGDLRLVLNLEKIVPSPYFRTYWIQQNITDTSAYRAGVSDMFLASGEYREERVLLRKETPAAANTANASAVADLARFVPANAGAYQIAASPTADASLALLETKLLAPHPGHGVASQLAPGVQLTSGETGSASDLETRIDQAPLEVRPQTSPAEPLKQLLARSPVRASLNVQRTDLDRDHVFVRIHTAVVLSGSSDWNEAEVRSALADFVRPALTTSGLGVNWMNQSSHFELDGLWTLSAAIRGKYLFLSDDPGMLEEISARVKGSSSEVPAIFVAGFNHAAERKRFVRLTDVLDGHAPGSSPAAGQSPEFFSGNIAGLSGVLAKLSSEKITVRDAGAKVLQTVIYEWGK